MNRIKKIAVFLVLIAAVTALGFVIASRVEASPENSDSVIPAPDAALTPSAELSETPKPKDIFTFSFCGDNTITNSNLNSHFDSVVKGDMNYCFKNVRKYFADDELTFGNLECVVSDRRGGSSSMFHFKAPLKNTEMLKNAGFEYMTLANNHMRDYGAVFVDDTKAALDSIGVGYAADAEYNVFTTKSGLKIGFYAGSQSANLPREKVERIVSELKTQGAEFIIFALHWGEAGYYRPTASQKNLAHMYIDSGVDIVYGSHPHVLQPVESYGDGLIIYSMGNFCFGGNSGPSDMDTAVIQTDLKRDSAGKLHIADVRLIPCRISSIPSSNDYCPTPYAEGTADYERALSKLTGEYKGRDNPPDYSFMDKYMNPKESPTPSPEVSNPPKPQESETPLPSLPPDEPVTPEPTAPPEEVTPPEEPPVPEPVPE